MKKLGAVILLAGFVALPALPAWAAWADDPPTTSELETRFKNTTLQFQDHRTNLPTSIYMDRWGTFEKYVPCVFTDGKWRITDKAKICWTDSEGAAPETCLKIKFGAAQMTFSNSAGNPLATAKLLKGNKLPLG